MRILAFDQSTKVTGWSLFIDEKYVDSGVIDLGKNKNTEDRSKQMGLAICKIITDSKPDTVVIEEVAMQSNAQTLKLLARIQGVAIGFCAAHNIPLHILEPSRWRSALSYKQGRAVKREELKQQSFDYVKEHLGFDYFSEDRCEACCINMAAHKIFDFDDEI
jgi:Holliday junction resolvasome RuvABC endonuclease subunit